MGYRASLRAPAAAEPDFFPAHYAAVRLTHCGDDLLR
jgi:hypothetical protein